MRATRLAGKSFFLDFCLRYLMGDATSQPECDSWLGAAEEALTGFSWRGGKERETTGIWMWSRPFFRAMADGEEVAVLLMDTQGTFDNETSMKGNCTVFALSTLLSSVQVRVPHAAGGRAARAARAIGRGLAWEPTRAAAAAARRARRCTT